MSVDSDLIEVEVLKVLVNESSCIVFLKEKEGNQRVLSIWVGIFEGRGIIMAWEGSKSERPFTYDLTYQILNSFSLKVEKLVIKDLKDHVFFGYLYISDGQTVIEHDVRPSDGMALALRFGAPIYIHEKVFKIWQEEANKQGEIFSLVEKNEGKSIFDVLDEKDEKDRSAINADIQKLMEQLEKAIRDEKYEDAARLRDRINDLRNKYQEL